MRNINMRQVKTLCRSRSSTLPNNRRTNVCSANHSRAKTLYRKMYLKCALARRFSMSYPSSFSRLCKVAMLYISLSLSLSYPSLLTFFLSFSLSFSLSLFLSLFTPSPSLYPLPLFLQIQESNGTTRAYR